ncbi:MAG: hypothetical protein WC869_13655 [Phycisphaerae bacterium]|jgi:5-methyltetrahydrofolate--homocysteine methyltransferase
MPIDFGPDKWTRIRENYRRWWAGELDRPLINITVSGRNPGRPEPKLPRHFVLPNYGPEISAEQIVDRWDYDLSCQKYYGDAFPYIWTNFGPGVIAEFLGARAEATDRTVWFHPPELREIADIHFTHHPHTPCLDRLRDLMAVAVKRWAGRVQVSMTDLGGNLDILSTFRPSEQLLLDLYDHPREVKRLTWEAHELWFRYFEELNAILQPVNPGYTGWTPIFSAEPCYMLQCDFCYMISPEMFDEFVKPELVAACKRLANSFYHLDGPGQLRHLDSLLAIKELKGVQWIPGNAHPDMRHWPEVYRKIRDAGKLIQLYSWDALDTLDVVADQLGSAKGIIVVGDAGPQQEDQVLKLVEKYGAADA